MALFNLISALPLRGGGGVASFDCAPEDPVQIYGPRGPQHQLWLRPLVHDLINDVTIPGALNLAPVCSVVPRLD